MADTRPSLAAIGLAPLLLRVILGLTFVWAGVVKWSGTMPVAGEDAAFLANLGVLDRPVKPAGPGAGAPAAPLPTPPKSQVNATGMLTLAQANPPGGGAKAAPVTAGPPVLTAADFPEPVPCRMMWMLAVGIHHAAHPADGAMPLWPKAIGEGLWPKVLAMCVFAAELGGGALVLIGLFTRTGAFAIAGVMIGAMWLTQIGPVVQSGKGLLGILPAKDWMDMSGCQTLLWQAALFGMAGALVLLGSGALAIDRALSGYRSARPAPQGGSSAR